MNEIRSLTGELKYINQGNVKIYVSNNRLIYRVYPFDIQTNRSMKRSTERTEQKKWQRWENNIAKRLKLLGYGLCNDWQYFFTGTIDHKRYDAYNFEAVNKLISYEFEKIKKRDKNFKYCYILEPHEDGAFHAHGFINISDSFVNPHPYYYSPVLKKKIYPSKSKFIQFGIKQELYDLGINTISPCIDINNISDYCGKYILKDIATGEKHSKSIFHSKGLKTFDVQYGNYIGDSFESLQDIIADNYSLIDVRNFKREYQGNIMQLEVKLT